MNASMELQEYNTEDFLLNDSFIRYCLQSDQQDIQFWENWILHNPGKQTDVTEAKKLLFSLGIRLTPVEKEHEFQKLKQLIEESIAEEKQNGQHPVVAMPVRRKARWFVAAAAACLLFVAGYAVKWLSDTHSINNNNSALAYMIYTTHAGERKVLELADGSSIILNSNSTLKIPSDFNQEKRTLQLTGEAFFDVAKNKNKPFIVSSKNIAVEALGTSFKVRSYDFDPAMRVALVEGKVRIENTTKDKRSTETLLPGEQVRIHSPSGKMNKEKFDIGREMDWKENKLVFKDASLSQIAAQLEYWYGLKVNLAISAPRKISFNGEFINGDLDRVLTAITYVNKLNYTVEHKQITITSVK